MRQFISSIFPSRPGREQEPIFRSSFTPNTDVEALTTDETLLTTRQLMTLSRRRRCAANHLGLNNPFSERFLDSDITNWYLNRGYTQEHLAQVLGADLIAILENPTQISQALQKRIILTGYFSYGELVDHYDYGDIHPFTFKTEETTVNFRDTLSDRMSFPQRIATVISFDPESRGHKHQIRYFRALLAAYSLAHILKKSTTDVATQQAIELLLQDEVELARGWVTTKKHAEELGINYLNFPPDENLLYSQDKVLESGYLFREYSNHSSVRFFNLFDHLTDPFPTKS